MKTVYVGDCGVDEYNGKLLPGGCALNVAYYAQKSDLNIDMVSCLGDDEAAKIPLSICQKIGLEIDYIHILPGQTPKQKIQVLPNGEKKFIGYFPGVLSDFNLSQKDIDYILQHEVLITLYYTQISLLFNQVTKIKFPGLKVVDFMDGCDFNYDINFVKKYAGWWDIGFFGLSGNDSNLIKDLLQLAKNMNKMVVITLGSGGSLVVCHNKIFKVKAKSIQAVDTTGCGDAYLAGFLNSWLKNKDIHLAIKAGSLLAIGVAKYQGAINPKMG